MIYFFFHIMLTQNVYDLWEKEREEKNQEEEEEEEGSLAPNCFSIRIYVVKLSMGVS